MYCTVGRGLYEVHGYSCFIIYLFILWYFFCVFTDTTLNSQLFTCHKTFLLVKNKQTNKKQEMISIYKQTAKKQTCPSSAELNVVMWIEKKKKKSELPKISTTGQWTTERERERKN